MHQITWWYKTKPRTSLWATVGHERFLHWCGQSRQTGAHVWQQNVSVLHLLALSSPRRNVAFQYGEAWTTQTEWIQLLLVTLVVSACHICVHTETTSCDWKKKANKHCGGTAENLLYKLSWSPPAHPPFCQCDFQRLCVFAFHSSPPLLLWWTVVELWLQLKLDLRKNKNKQFKMQVRPSSNFVQYSTVQQTSIQSTISRLFRIFFIKPNSFWYNFLLRCFSNLQRSFTS